MDRHHKHEKWVSGKPLTILRGYVFEEKKISENFTRGQKYFNMFIKRFIYFFIIKEKKTTIKKIKTI